MMLLQKSEENIEAAKLLFENMKYNSVVHSAYYSCFQLMLYIENSELYDDVSENSHNNLIKSFVKEIDKRKLYQESIDFNNNITKLKTKRKLSDYKKHIFPRKESEKSYSLAICIRKQLQKIFINKE